MADIGVHKILVVDDDQFVRQLLTTVVQKAGYEVETARDGAEALEKLNEHSFSLVLLDLMMPRVDGVAVLEAMAREKSTTPVVVMTAADDSLVGKLPKNQVERVMKKPFDVNDLIDTIRSIAA